MRSALVPGERAAASEQDWRRFLEELQRELWSGDRSAPKSEDRP
jgi:hypothetical protein